MKAGLKPNDGDVMPPFDHALRERLDCGPQVGDVLRGRLAVVDEDGEINRLSGARGAKNLHRSAVFADDERIGPEARHGGPCLVEHADEQRPLDRLCRCRALAASEEHDGKEHENWETHLTYPTSRGPGHGIARAFTGLHLSMGVDLGRVKLVGAPKLLSWCYLQPRRKCTAAQAGLM